MEGAQPAQLLAAEGHRGGVAGMLPAVPGLHMLEGEVRPLDVPAQGGEDFQQLQVQLLLAAGAAVQGNAQLFPLVAHAVLF